MCKKLTLPLQVGKKYINRDGFVRTVLMTDRKTDDGRTVLTVGPSKDFPRKDVVRFHKPDGIYKTGVFRGEDLIEDYVEPIEDRYVVVTRYGDIYYSMNNWNIGDLQYHFGKDLVDGGRIIKIREVRD